MNQQPGPASTVSGAIFGAITFAAVFILNGSYNDGLLAWSGHPVAVAAAFLGGLLIGAMHGIGRMLMLEALLVAASFAGMGLGWMISQC